ncbi:hypothetical protein WN943_028798 [Citrus x changshan-huyou]
MKLRMKSNEVRQRHSQVPQKDKERVNCQLLRYNEATQRPQKDFTRLSPRRQKPDTTASPRLDSQVSNLFTSGVENNMSRCVENSKMEMKTFDFETSCALKHGWPVYFQ